MDIGKLTAADEGLHHQIADTFATVAESDLGWTEKIWAALVRKDGTLALSFGLGKYQNRNVLDGFAGVARGNEQWTIRASRRLDTALLDTSVGPITYEIVEPLKKVRFCLEANDTQPIAFDILFEGELPPAFEERNRQRAGFRIRMDVVRYFQTGKLSGWVEINGHRETVDDGWFGARDHSWGMRGNAVGALPTDVQPSGLRSKQTKVLWGPSLIVRPDGSRYQMLNFLQSSDFGKYFSGHIREISTNGEVTDIGVREMQEDIVLDPTTRRFIRSTLNLALSDGTERLVTVNAVGDSGFHLRTGGYGSWGGHRQGEWRGDLHVEGDHIADVLAALPQLGQFRDAPVTIREGNATGFGIQESIYNGVFPELGLGEDSDFDTYG